MPQITTKQRQHEIIGKSTWMPQGTFSHLWFAQFNAKIFARYLPQRQPAPDDPLNYLEIGVCEGMSMLWMLEHLGMPKGNFIGIDSFGDARNYHPGEGEEHRTRTLDNLALWYGTGYSKNPGSYWQFVAPEKPVCQIFKQTSQEWLASGPHAQVFDVVYVDGAHNADEALTDLALVWPYVRNGGVMLVDDYDKKISGGRPQVFQALNAFMSCFEGCFDILFWHQRIVGLTKRSKRRRRGYPPILEQGPIIDPDE